MLRHVLTILAVRDLRDMVGFYRAVLGQAPAVQTPVYVEFTLEGGQRLGLYAREGFGRNTGKVPAEIPQGELAPTELYFQVEDLAGAIERVSAARARMLSPRAPRPWGDEVAYFADPSGNIIALAAVNQAAG